MRRLSSVLFLCSGIILTGSAMATTYKWVDEEGNVHYSQTPPEGRDVEKIAPPPAVAAPPVKKEMTEPEKAESEEEKDKAETAKVSDEHQAEIYRKNCEAARKNLKSYETSRRIKTAEGEIITLSDEMRQEKMKQAQEAIDKYCK